MIQKLNHKQKTKKKSIKQKTKKKSIKHKSIKHNLLSKKKMYGGGFTFSTDQKTDPNSIMNAAKIGTRIPNSAIKAASLFGIISTENKNKALLLKQNVKKTIDTTEGATSQEQLNAISRKITSNKGLPMFPPQTTLQNMFSF